MSETTDTLVEALEAVLDQLERSRYAPAHPCLSMARAALATAKATKGTDPLPPAYEAIAAQSELRQSLLMERLDAIEKKLATMVKDVTFG